MIFSKSTGYGIRALAYLAKRADDGPCGLREIAESEGIPPLYLGKVLGELRRHRLVRSTKGIHGGYELAQPPQEISLWEVFRILEPDPHLDTCILGHGVCDSEDGCPLHADWHEVRQKLLTFLKSKTISNIAATSARA
jgi:Rrf2 family protein